VSERHAVARWFRFQDFILSRSGLVRMHHRSLSSPSVEKFFLNSFIDIDLQFMVYLYLLHIHPPTSHTNIQILVTILESFLFFRMSVLKPDKQM